MTFQDLNLNTPLQNALSDLGYIYPTPIQHQALPHDIKWQGCYWNCTNRYREDSGLPVTDIEAA